LAKSDGTLGGLVAAADGTRSLGRGGTRVGRRRVDRDVIRYNILANSKYGNEITYGG
jgi:hypothetical protein